MMTQGHDSRASDTLFLDEDRYDWTKPEAFELHTILVNAYSDAGRARHLLAMSGVDVSTIHIDQPIRTMWTQALDAAARAGKTRSLVKVARQDPSVAAYHARLGRLLGPQPRPVEPTAPTSVMLPWKGHELVTGAQETFLDMSFLHEGLRMARSVVRLTTQTAEKESFIATGFLIAQDTILTNHHVLFDRGGRPVEQVDIWFNYELDGARRPVQVDTYLGEVRTIMGDADLDWAVIRTRSRVEDAYPTFDLRPSRPVRSDDFVFIIQHPQGRMKQIGLLHNQVVNVTDTHVQYLTDTLPGSSGAPVCNEHWQVVALHHRGIEAEPGSAGSHKNQGIRIDRVREGLVARGVLPEERR